LPAISTVISGIALASTAAGTALGYVGQQKAQKGQEKAEKTREQAMNLDANRQRRRMIRESMAARSLALSNATSQGAQAGSGLQGGYGQISGQTNTNIQGVNQQQQLGAQLFSANRQQVSGNSMSNFGSGLRALGSDLYNSAGSIDRIGTTLFA
jgi:hypothetical protein